MQLFKQVKRKLSNSVCKTCGNKVTEIHHQLYALPNTVGNYQTHRHDPSYYRENLREVCSKEMIPTGRYACELTVYKCFDCGHQKVCLSIFLPVRDEEKYEEIFYYDHGELDDFLYRTTH